MDLVKNLEKLEDKFYTAPEENKEEIVKGLLELHLSIEDVDTLNRFAVQASERFGGIYIPYLFWDKLAAFLESDDERFFLQDLLKAFSNSNFDDDEQRKMKPLIITYFAHEKEFEVNKLKSLMIDKTHPTVKEYFYSLIQFVEKNKRSTQMYKDKFELLRQAVPDFQLMAMPITQLKDKFQSA